LISGTLYPNKGNVILDDKDLLRMKSKEIARRMAVVPQDSEIGFDFTVREVVSMGRYPHLGRFQFDNAESTRIVDGAMSIMGVLDMAQKPISKLSGGEKQRAIIARALAQEPDILLLDEPTKNLDIRHSLDILKLVRKMNSQRGLTVLAVFHDLDLAARFCKRVVILKGGRVHSKGEIVKVLTPDMIKEVFDVSAEIRKEGRIRVDIQE
jgi:iron complex transport system ATP-binding protein